jgi:arabinofuranosyltransferase
MPSIIAFNLDLNFYLTISFFFLLILLILLKSFSTIQINKHLIYSALASVVLVPAINLLPCAEDAFIGYRYADNLAAGHGLVWNIDDPVEGYSNLLWILILSLLKFITGSPTPTLAYVVSVPITLLYVYYYYDLAIIALRNEKRAIIAASGGIIFGGIIIYAMSGMETMLFGLLVVLSIRSYIKDEFIYAAIFITLSGLTRPEGLVIGIAIWTQYVLYYRTDVNFKSNILKLMGIPLIVTAIHFIFRKLYYGYFIPNTVAAKSAANFYNSITVGAQDAFNFFLWSGMGILIIASAVILMAYYFTQENRERNNTIKVNAIAIAEYLRSSNAIILLITCFGFGSFYVISGGDWMPGWRYWTPIFPLLFLCVFAFIEESKISRKTMIVTCVVVAMASWNIFSYFSNSNMLRRADQWIGACNTFTNMGRSLNRIFGGSNVVMASSGAGALPYYSKLKTVDMGGLNDTHIGRFGKKSPIYLGGQGHFNSDNDYAISLNADIMWWGNKSPIQPGPPYRLIEIGDHSAKYWVWIHKKAMHILENYIGRNVGSFQMEISPYSMATDLNFSNLDNLKYLRQGGTRVTNIPDISKGPVALTMNLGNPSSAELHLRFRTIFKRKSFLIENMEPVSIGVSFNGQPAGKFKVQPSVNVSDHYLNVSSYNAGTSDRHVFDITRELYSSQNEFSIFLDRFVILGNPFVKYSLAGTRPMNLLGVGWFGTEASHTYTNGNKVSMNFPQIEPGKDIIVLAKWSSILGRTQRVSVVANGHPVTTITVKRSEFGTDSFTIPADFLKSKSANTISFDLPDAVSPASLGVSQDKRVMGLAVKELSLFLSK